MFVRGSLLCHEVIVMSKKDKRAKGDANGAVSGNPKESKQLSDRPPRPVAILFHESAVPSELRKLRQWVFWKYVWVKNKNKGKGKWDKPPFNSRTGRNASTTNPRTWGTFEEAVAACRRYGGDGIGFVFTKDDPYCGIDFDDVRDPVTGKLTDEAAADIARLDSFSEVSPSGKGVHVIVKATLPAGGKHPEGLGIFNTARYFCITAAAVPGSPPKINERQEVVNELLAKMCAKKEAEAAARKQDKLAQMAEASEGTTKQAEPVTGKSVAGVGSDLTDEEIIALAGRAKNGKKFKALWGGNINGYPSQSEADLALCSLLVFYCGPDHDRIDALFRQSGLFRQDKWADRTDYRERTIALAIEGRTQFYKPFKNGSGRAVTGDGRQYFLVVVGHNLRTEGKTKESVLARLKTINSQRCSPPLPDGMVERIAKVDALDGNWDRSPGDDTGIACGDDGNEKPERGDGQGHDRNGDGQNGGHEVERGAEKPEHDGAVNGFVPLEAVDDPHKLARDFLVQECTHKDGPTLTFWHEEFHRWDGSAYRGVPAKELGAEVTRAAKTTLDHQNLIDQEVAAIFGKKPPQTRKVTSRLVTDVSNALASLTMLPGLVDAPSWLGGDGPFPASECIAFRNGLVHLLSLVEGKPHFCPPTPRFFSPNSLDIDFDLNAPPPTAWLAFLSQIWPDDLQCIDTVQDWFGYMLLGDTSQQKIMMLVGPKRAGKGTIARVLRGLVGHRNAAAPTLASLATNFGLWPLVGKTLAVISDARLGVRTDVAAITERLLAISGEDPQPIDRKYLPILTTTLKVRFMVLTNELPKLSDASGALASRMLVLRMTESFFGRENTHLTNQLLKELPGISLWAIEGWRRLRERGYFIQPDSGKEMLVELENLASPVGEFVRECCQVGTGYQVDRSVLFAAWLAWCATQNRENAGDPSSFGRDLRTVVPKLKSSQHRDATGYRGWFYDGIGLR